VQLVLRAVGYRGQALPGVPFDSRSHLIPNDGGRVLDPPGTVLPGAYATGWIKRGPSGVIGTNKADSMETARALLADLPSLTPAPDGEPESVERFLRERGARVVGWHDWLEIDRHERELGERDGRERAKVTNFEPLLERFRSAASRD
jgi:ferredoxin--NADP+ reductase